jgi:hypothetical protein
MKNETKQTAVDKIVSLLNKKGFSPVLTDEEIKLFKEMEKEQIMNAIKNELKLIGNYFDVSKLEQREQGHHIRFTSILKDRFDFYNETYGGNK